MKMKNKTLYSLKLKEQSGYIYFTLIAGNQNIGYMVEVHNYWSLDEEKEDFEKILNSPSLFPSKFILAEFIEADDDYIHALHKIKLSKDKTYEICVRSSLRIAFETIKLGKALGLSKDHTVEEYSKVLIEYVQNGNRITLEDWEIVKYGITKTGRFDYINTVKVGLLPAEHKDDMLFGSWYLIDDIETYFREGIDRLSAEKLLFQ